MIYKNTVKYDTMKKTAHRNCSYVVCYRSYHPAYADEPRGFDSLQMKGVAVVKVPVDADAAAQRLSGAIKFPTISNQDRKDFDEKAFNDLHQYLATNFPLIHKTLKREIVGDPRKLGLHHTWQGSDPSLQPTGLTPSARSMDAYVCRRQCGVK